MLSVNTQEIAVMQVEMLYSIYMQFIIVLIMLPTVKSLCNLTGSVLDRHVMESPERVALIWEPNEPGKAVHVTYRYTSVVNLHSHEKLHVCIICTISKDKLIKSK